MFTALVSKQTDYGGKGKYAVVLRNHTIMTNGFFIEPVNENIEEDLFPDSRVMGFPQG